MSEVIERLAVAIMRSRHHMGKPAHLQPERQSHGGILLPISIQQENWEGCVRDAYAALTAMREPTDEMKNTGAMVRSNGQPFGSPEDWNNDTDCAGIWRAMIAEALK